MAKPMRSDCKSERIVEMRLAGVPYKQIAHIVGGSPVSARVLFHKRKIHRSRLLADMSKLPAGAPAS